MLEALTADAALVLVLEDLHWSDGSTLDLDRGARCGRRSRSTTPRDVGPWDRPIIRCAARTALRRQSTSCAGSLPGAVEAYLRRRCLRGEPAVAASLQHLTTGNPLFLTMLVDHLLAQGVLSNASGRWELTGPSDDPRGQHSGEPAGDDRSPARPAHGERSVHPRGGRRRWRRVLRSDRSLPPRAWMRSGGGGMHGRSLAGASSCECSAPRRGRRQRSGALRLRPRAPPAILYDRVTAARRQRLHRSIGERLAAGWAVRPSEVAAELAMHFERGRDYRQAMVHARELAVRAFASGAHREAIAASERALELLSMEPETHERSRQMLMLHDGAGIGAPDDARPCRSAVEETFERARQLGEQIQDVAGYFWPSRPRVRQVVRGIWRCRAARGSTGGAGGVLGLGELLPRHDDRGHGLQRAAHRAGTRSGTGPALPANLDSQDPRQDRAGRPPSSRSKPWA